MVIRFYCGCGKRLSAPDGTSGRHAKCPVCGTRVLIPEEHPAGEEVPMAVPQKPADVILEEPAGAEGPPPPASGTLPSAEASVPQPVVAAEHLQLATQVGAIVMAATGVIAFFATAVDAIARRTWSDLILISPEVLILFLLIGMLGYVGGRGGIRRLLELAGEVRDRTIPLSLALVSFIVALLFFWQALFLMTRRHEFGDALPWLGMCAASLLIALIWRNPEFIGIAVRDEPRAGRWSFLEAILGLVELSGKAAFASSVILFSVASAFTALAMLVSVLAGFINRTRVDMLSLIWSHLVFIALLGVAPLLGYLALLLVHAVAHTVRVWVATENNTRRPAGQ